MSHRHASTKTVRSLIHQCEHPQSAERRRNLDLSPQRAPRKSNMLKNGRLSAPDKGCGCMHGATLVSASRSWRAGWRKDGGGVGGMCWAGLMRQKMCHEHEHHFTSSPHFEGDHRFSIVCHIPLHSRPRLEIPRQICKSGRNICDLDRALDLGVVCEMVSAAKLDICGPKCAENSIAALTTWWCGVSVVWCAAGNNQDAHAPGSC